VNLANTHKRSRTTVVSPSGPAGPARVDRGMPRLKTMLAAAARLRARIEWESRQAATRERLAGRPFKL